MRVVLIILLVLALPASAAAAGDPQRARQAAAAGDPLRPRQWNLDMVKADAAHVTATGAGATIAIVDSGVQAGHPDLAGRLAAGSDLVDGDGTPQDGSGHGTHVIGIAGAASGNGAGIASVAPGAQMLPVRVLDDSGAGDEATVARGIDWAREHGADVINLSLGSEVPLVGAAGGDEIDGAIRRALAAGVVVVAASGNSGVPVCEQPAADSGLLCVGAVDRRGQRSFFSSFGSGLGVMAPGGSSLPLEDEDVISTYPPAGYEELAGTSQAAPHVAGVAALLVGLGVRGEAAVDRILATAADAGAPGVDAEYGHGIVDAAAAVAGLGRPVGGGAPPAESSPRAVLRMRRHQRLGRAIRVRVRAVSAGRVRVRVTARGHTIARGARQVEAGRARVVRARLTTRGRRLARRGGPVRARVRVRLPGERGVRVRRVRLG